MIRKANPETDQIARSLLQKAVRRADLEITQRTLAYLIHQNDFEWIKKRLAVITFEECWTYGLEVSYENDKTITSNHIQRLVGTIKNKNAAGLGSLAYALSEGDKTVYDDQDHDKDVHIIAAAIKRHDDFWSWAKSQDISEKQKTLIEKAQDGFKKAGWPWDKAFTLAAAYLAITEGVPDTTFIETRSDPNFPLWTAIDKHTPEGKIAIQKAAKRINITSNVASWLSFYFESAKCNQIEQSPWWERERKWRINKLGLTLEQGEQMWQQLTPILINILDENTALLKSRIFDTHISISKESIAIPLQKTLF